MMWHPPRRLTLACLALTAVACAAPAQEEALPETSERDAAPAPTGLVDGPWRLAAIDMMDGTDAIPSSPAGPIIEFSAEATPAGSRWLSGSGGCARYMGAYDAGRSGGFSLDGPLVITRSACSEADLQLLSLYSIGMESATRYSIEGDSLAIEFGGGTLRFLRAVPPGA